MDKLKALYFGEEITILAFLPASDRGALPLAILARKDGSIHYVALVPSYAKESTLKLVE